MCSGVCGQCLGVDEILWDAKKTLWRRVRVHSALFG